jgi:hypothetical protein
MRIRNHNSGFMDAGIQDLNPHCKDTVPKISKEIFPEMKLLASFLYL